MKRVCGRQKATFVDPTGYRVNVNRSIVDHMVENPAGRRDGREAYFPLIPETVEVPAEI